MASMKREINSSNREVNFEHHNTNTHTKKQPMKAAPRATVMDVEKIGTIWESSELGSW